MKPKLRTDMTSAASPIREYHAHFYFTEATAASAAERMARAREALGARPDIWHWTSFPKPVGPHPTPMWEMDFGASALEGVIPWLMLHRGPHSVLVHPDTGSDLPDHRDHALWLGPPLELLWDRLT